MISQRIIGYSISALAIVLIVIFSMANVELDKTNIFLCQAVSSNPDINMAQCPAHTSDLPWLITMGFSISILLLVGGIFLILYPWQKGDKKRKKASMIPMEEDEKKVFALLSENNGSMYQSDLIKQTGFSKVKITRVLDKMATKEIIDRQRRGMTNIVVLK